MAKKMTKQEYDAWRSQHAGKNQFEIFHKDGGEAVVDFTFWAATREAAVDELELFKQKQQLIAPSAETEYFYREINNHVVAHKDGTYTVGRGLTDIMGFGREKESWWEKIKNFFMSISWKTRDIKYMLHDVAFWFGHYDMKTNHGEERCDYWDIRDTVERKLLFNIPRLIEKMHGCPQPYVNKAVDTLRAVNGQPPASRSNYINANADEMAEAVKLWKDELRRLMLYIRLFHYYDSYGVTDDSAEMKKIDKEYKKTLPVYPGTDGELDYDECNKMANKYWELYCDLWKKIGRMCWD